MCEIDDPRDQTYPLHEDWRCTRCNFPLSFPRMACPKCGHWDRVRVLRWKIAPQSLDEPPSMCADPQWFS